MNLLHDLRIATRSLRRTPGFTALSTVVLALGLAVVVMMFAIVWEIGYEPPPADRPETLVGIKTIDTVRNDLDRAVDPHDYVEWTRSQTVFENMAAFYDGTVTVSGHGPAERYTGGFVSGHFFELMGLPPLLGRGIEPRDALPGASPVVVLGADLWRTRFRSDPALVGTSLRVNGQTATIVGIANEKLAYPGAARLWVPLREPYDARPRGEDNWVDVIARLKPGVTLDEAQAQMAVIGARIAREHPQTNASIVPDVMPIALQFSGREDMRLFHTFLVSVFLVLIIACVNVAGLMLVRATSRTQEAGIRRALGAGRLRLMREMLSESFIIGALAALLGLTLAAAALEVLDNVLVRYIEDLPPWWDFSVDGPVAAFAIGLAFISTLLAGLYPALRVSGLDVNAILREGSRDTGLSTGRVVRWLVVVEIALSCALLTTAGIMIRTALYASGGDVGADVRPFMGGRVGLVGEGYTEEEQIRFIEKLLPKLQAVPGATAAAITDAPPAWGANEDSFAMRGQTYSSKTDYPNATFVAVSPGFFDAFRVPVLQGRDFTLLDRRGSQPVALVSESFVREFFPDGNALGKQVQINPSNPESPWLTIVGVVGNILHDDEPFQVGEPQPTIYRPLLQSPSRFFTGLLRTDADPHALGPAIRDAVSSIDPDMPVYFLRTIPESRALNSGGLRVLGGMFAAFGLITIVLTGAGIYGVLAYSVAQSSREIAIRRALGAPDRGIVQSIVVRSGWQLGLGLTLGVLIAPLMAAGMSAATGGGSMHDSRIYAIVFTVLTLAIAAATLFPLRRALNLQPIVALRHT